MFGERISWQNTCGVLAGIYICGRLVSKEQFFLKHRSHYLEKTWWLNLIVTHNCPQTMCLLFSNIVSHLFYWFNKCFEVNIHVQTSLPNEDTTDWHISKCSKLKKKKKVLTEKKKYVRVIPRMIWVPQRGSMDRN